MRFTSSLRGGLVALLALGQPACIWSKTIAHDFHLSWITTNPDGAYAKPTIGINNQWPPPLISATVGDEVVVNLHNGLGNTTTSLHFHGLFQNGTNHMDGAVGVTQCPVPPGHTFTYRFKVDQPGTYWYHAHNNGQYPDGLRGPVVVHDPAGPHEGKYDDEIVLTLSDWYHRPMKELIAGFLNYKNPSGAEPVPQAALMNDTQDLRVKVEPEKTYLVRMVNVGAFASHFVRFEGHQVRVVEADGVWMEESAPVDVLYLAAAQRYSVLLKAKSDATQNFAIVSTMDEELFDDAPEDLNPSVTGWLVYNEEKPLPEPDKLAPDSGILLDDMNLVPADKFRLLDAVSQSIEFNIHMKILGNGVNYAFFNNITYVGPKVPTLYTALTVGGATAATNPIVYGSHTNTHVLRHNDVVELVVNNFDDGDHPFHLHGHNFQVITRSDADAGPFVPSNRPRLQRDIPLRRDTVLIRGNGHAVLRFVADNPGAWLFHCHIEWHMEQGLVATLVSAPEQLLASGAKHPQLPRSHLESCKLSGMAAAGNAAGNADDVLDLTGENRPPPPLPKGFTTKGYVALVCSGVAAVMGMASIWYYGNIPDMQKGYEAI
ncbi:hypothetical protein ACKVWC_000179 [Pyricularia oryzae]